MRFDTFLKASKGNNRKSKSSSFHNVGAAYTKDLSKNELTHVYYYIAPTYLCELISRRESSVNTRLGSDQHQLIMPPISKDCSNTFLDRSFIYAAPCEWNKLSECIRTSSFDSFRKSVKTMLFTQQYG